MLLRSKQIDLSQDLNFTGGNLQLASGRIFVGDGTESQPSVAFTSDPGSGLFLAGPGEVAISAGANAFVYLKDDGTVEMTGTTGLAIQAGTTGERPDTPLDGLIRYNLDNDAHETFVDSEWADFVLGNDSRLQEYNIVKVSKDPGTGQFSTIASALAAISGASSTNRYMISVGPGIFDEPTLVVPSFVSIEGKQGATHVRSDGANKHLFHLDVSCSVSSLQVSGTSGANYAAFYVHTANSLSTGSVLLNNIIYGANNTQVYVQQDTGTFCTVFSEGGHIGAYGSFDQGFKAVGPGAARINVRSLTTNGTTSPGMTSLFHADGPLCTVLSTGSLYRNSQTTGTGIHLRNGATGRFVGVSLLGFQKAIWLENFGAGPIFNGDGINLQSNVMDLVVDHPGSTGHFLGCAEHSKVSVDAAAAVSVFYSDPVTTGITSVGPLYLGPSHAKTTEMSGLFSRSTTMGLLVGGVITTSAPGTIDISAGYGYASISDPIHRTTRISWPASTLNLPEDASVFIYFTNAGVLSYNALMPDLTTNILLGRVTTDGTFIAWIDVIPADANHTGNKIESMLRRAFGTVYASGSTVMENASNARHLDIAAGEYYYGTNKFQPSGVVDATLSTVYHVSGDWTYTNLSAVTNSQYDDGTDLVSLSTDYYAKHSLYVAGDGAQETYLLVVAQAEYATLIEVEAAELPLPPTSFNDSVTTLIASVIVQQGNANIVEIFDQRPVLGANPGALSASADHGNLLGLADDDHPQYLLSSGARAMSGALNMATNNILNAGTINGVTITGHASRHLPNGADPLTTEAAVGLSPSTTNTVGFANSFARSDHTHVITGFQPLDPDLTALAELATTGVIVRTGSGTATLRWIKGTTGQITVVNEGGESGDPTISIAENAILTGTGSNSLATGTTAQRPVSPTAGAIRYNSTLSCMEVYIGSSWLALINSNDLTAYLKIDGTTTMTGALNMGSQNITNAGTINGVSITAHAARHLPGGADALTTASAVGLSLASTSTTGTAASFARSDHTHAITGVQPISGQLTSLAAFAGAGMMARTAADTFAARTITGTTNTITVTNGSGVSGDPVITIAPNPVLPGTAGCIVPTGNTAQRVNTNGAVRYNSDLGRIEFYQNASWGGFISTEQVAAGYQPLDTDLTAIAGLGTTGLIVRTASGTAATRTISGTAGNISVTNGDGISGNPTANLVATGVTAAQYDSVSVDIFGRVTDGILDSDIFTGARFDTIASGNWPVTNSAPAAADTTHTTLTIRAFDDARSEGVGITTQVPVGATSVLLQLRGRPRNAPGASVTAVFQVYAKRYPMGSAPGVWSSAVAMTNVVMASGTTFFAQTNTSLAISALGIQAGDTVQLEIVRVGANGSDTLSGDYHLVSVGVEWT